MLSGGGESPETHASSSLTQAEKELAKNSRKHKKKSKYDIMSHLDNLVSMQEKPDK